MKPEKIILHCSATPKGRDVKTATIKTWHTSPPRNWSDIGYHYVIELDGKIKSGRPMYRSGAHTKGHNNSVGICYVGGLSLDGKTSEDTMTKAQVAALKSLVKTIRKRHGNLTLHGHNEFSNKDCPSFNVVQKFGHDFCYPDDFLIGPLNFES